MELYRTYCIESGGFYPVLSWSHSSVLLCELILCFFSLLYSVPWYEYTAMHLFFSLQMDTGVVSCLGATPNCVSVTLSASFGEDISVGCMCRSRMAGSALIAAAPQFPRVAEAVTLLPVLTGVPVAPRPSLDNC